MGFFQYLVFDTTRKMVNRYVPKKYSGLTVLFVPKERETYPDNPAFRIDPWFKYFDGIFNSHIVPGKHLDIFKEPNVQILAEKLNSYLKNASMEKNH